MPESKHGWPICHSYSSGQAAVHPSASHRRSHDQQDFFQPYLGDLPKGQVKMLMDTANNLRRTLIYRNGLFPLGLLAFCVEHPRDERAAYGGIFAAIRKGFADLAATNFGVRLNAVKDFRNKYIAHAEEELTDKGLAKKQLGLWLEVMARMHSPVTGHESRVTSH